MTTDPPPLPAPDLAMCKMAVALVTAGQEGRAAFSETLAGFNVDIASDPKHPLHGNGTYAHLAWALTLICIALGDVLQEACPDAPGIFAAWLRGCGQDVAAWPVAEGAP